MNTKRAVAVALAGVVFLTGASAPNCRGLYNLEGAPMVDPDAGSEILTTCASAITYASSAEPALQKKCATCHVSGSEGASKMTLVAGSGLSGGELLKNYRAALRQLLEDDSGVAELNPIILAPLVGDAGHKVVFTGLEDASYLDIKDWIIEERESPCGLASSGE